MSKKEKKVKQPRAKRMPTILEALIPVVAMLLVLFIGKGVLGFSTEPLLIIVACVAAFIAWRVGCTWDDMLDEISQKIAKGMPAILILITVGAMVGTWMTSGTIPMMIYYGVQIVSPKWLLVTAFLITCLVSVATGTSWGSVATMGVALMGIASALGVNPAATAGAVIAGSYFGDKISPLSDTTNLAPLAAGSNLYEHIGHMFWTTVPATIVSLVVYAIVGLNANTAAGATSEAVTNMMAQLDQMYDWNILILLPVILVLAGSLLKLPTIPVMILSTVVAGVEGIFMQGISLGNVLTSTVSGFNVTMITRPGFDAANAAFEVTKLLNRGGMNGIMSTTGYRLKCSDFAGENEFGADSRVVHKEVIAVCQADRRIVMEDNGDSVTAERCGFGKVYVVYFVVGQYDCPGAL